MNIGKMMHIRTCAVFLMCSVAAHLASGEICSGIFERKEICCDNVPGLGCFTKDDPFSGLPLPCCPEGEEVTYALYTRSARSIPAMVRLDKPLPAEFGAARYTAFVAHGWMGSGDNDWVIQMKDALLDKEDYNVIAVSWKHAASYVRYWESASNTRTVGALTGLVMQKLVEEGTADPAKLWCIGHSLGAHMCGHAGYTMAQQKIGRITGLDPAGPWFESEEDLSVGLNTACAQFVDVIHSDTKGSINKYGTTRAVGHMDFYPNGLGRQPGCVDRRRRRTAAAAAEIEQYGFLGCSHGRAVEFMIESVTAGDCFISRFTCPDIDNMPGSCSPCEGDVCAVMGYGAFGSGAPGIHYLETKTGNYPPHCLG